MPVKMNARQLDFWRELLAPFNPEELSEVPARGTKKMLTYIDKRALSNRLDSVCGPDGWDVAYEATNRGYKCRLGILVPTAGEASVWHYKEDGAGFEEMGSKNRETGEFEYDVDNDEKSGYTNAFRRAAQDAWGIGRYLYKKGIPTFLDPNAAASATPALRVPGPPPSSAPAPSAPPPELADRQPPDRPAPTPRTGFDNFKIPPPGKSVFAWAKEMEKAFEVPFIEGMGRDGEALGWGKTFNTWDQTQVNTIAMKVIKYIRELPTYRGQFEHLFPGGQPDPKIATHGGPGQTQAPPVTPGVNVADLRKTLIAKMQALVTKQTGKPTDAAGLKAVFRAVAPIAKNSDGYMGEIPNALSTLADVVWITNMIQIVDQQIAEAVAGEAAGDECPF